MTVTGAKCEASNKHCRCSQRSASSRIDQEVTCHQLCCRAKLSNTSTLRHNCLAILIRNERLLCLADTDTLYASGYGFGNKSILQQFNSSTFQKFNSSTVQQFNMAKQRSMSLPSGKQRQDTVLKVRPTLREKLHPG